ncbi:MAG: TRAP transporter substrate-binding protein, partial [Comamonas sp.]
DIKTKGMQVNELSASEANRMREKLTSVNDGIAKTVGQDTWDAVQAAVKQARTK